MPAPYKHIFFDLDHTLWDFEKNCAETLLELYHAHSLHKHSSFGAEEFVSAYQLVNKQLWKDFHSGKLDKGYIRQMRFIFTFEQLGLKEEDVPANLEEQFLRICPAKSNVLPHAHEVLTYLKEKYTLHIITNGFYDIQNIKLSAARLGGYFSEIINSESCGYMKPDKRIFQFSLDKAKATPQECIMIGDDLEADVVGARNAGLDQVFFNPKQKPHTEEISYEINSLKELLDIL